MYYGGDYNPEQWPEATWHDDVALMREAGVNLVSLGIFSWSRIQPAEGVFDFEWLDTIIDLLHANGIGVDLATATASPPPWASIAYPGMRLQDADGAVYWHGSRQDYATTSPDYRRLASELVTALAARYAKHPAVVMWHVNNEYGCHVHHDYSLNAELAFRQWLQAKYSTIDALNVAWGTNFWSQRYTDFDQIVPPRKTPTSTNPAGLLDFKRFTSDSLRSLYVMERDIIRASGATQPITTNFMGAFPAADYWAWAKEVDFVSDDAYPDPNDPESFRLAAFERDLVRSLKPGIPWILMEQSSNALNWRPTNAPKAPGQMAALSVQSVARGADGVLFFQWRQSRSGSEKFHSGMVPHAGKRTRTWREIVGLGQELSALPPLAASDRSAKVALVFDWENWWAISSPDHPVALDYRQLIERWYSALHRQHVQVDIVQPTSDLTGYRVVVAPHIYLLTADAAANLVSFVESGGHLLVTAFSDVVDEFDAFRDGGYLMQLGPTLGIWLEDFGALAYPDHGPGQNRAPLSSSGGEIVGTLLAEEIHLDGAQAIGSFTGGRLDGQPAFTVATAGAGRAYYLATVPDAEGAFTATAHVLNEAGVDPVLPGLPDTVEVARRGSVVTVINFGAQPATFTLAGTDIQSGETVTSVTLAPYEYALVDDGKA